VESNNNVEESDALGSCHHRIRVFYSQLKHVSIFAQKHHLLN